MLWEFAVWSRSRCYDPAVPSEDESTVEQVRKWIELSGFPLEMRVAAAFREHNRPSVEQGFEYIDPVTNDVREGDVLDGME